MNGYFIMPGGHAKKPKNIGYKYILWYGEFWRLIIRWSHNSSCWDMDIWLEKDYGTLLQYMISAARLLYTQRWKDPLWAPVEKGLLVEVAKSTCLIREKSLLTFVKDWMSLIDFWVSILKNWKQCNNTLLVNIWRVI